MALDEVIVTARRIDENIQRVPISITAISAQTLTDRSVLNLGDLERLTPGLFYAPFGGQNTAPTLRGIGTYAAGDAGRPVVTYFAEVPLWPASGIPPVFDLQNIQVLKGPQGTLFGRNAIAGAVLLTPQAPTDEFGGYLKVAGGSHAYHAVEGAINIPLVEDQLSIRLAGLYQRRDGFTKNISGPDADDIKENNFRISALFTPNEQLSISQIVDYRRSPAAGQGFKILSLDPSLIAVFSALAPPFYACSGGNPLGNPSCDIVAALHESEALGPRAANYTIAPTARLKSWGSTTKASYTLGDVSLVNIFGLRRSRGQSNAEVDGLGLTVPLFVSYSQENVDQVSEEFHINGQAFDHRLTWIAGAFYSKSKQKTGGAFVPVGGPNYSTSFRTSINKAVFGQVSWDFSEAVEGLTLDAGVRYNWDHKTTCSRSDLPAPSVFPPLPGAPDPLAGRKDCGTLLPKFTLKDELPTWTVGLNYQANEDLFLYIASRRGYREGSRNTPNFVPAFLRPFQEGNAEKLTDVEIGAKWNWAAGDVRGRLDVDVYHSWYDGTQVGVPTAGLSQPAFAGGVCGGPLDAYCIPPDQQPAGTSLIVNLGSQEISGMEAQFSAALTENLIISGGVAYTHLDSTDFEVPIWAPSQVVAQFSPKWAANASLSYTLPFRPIDPDSTLVFHADFTYSGKIRAFGSGVTPAWDQTGVRLDWRDIGAKGVTLSGFVTNVFDQDNLIAVSASPGLLSSGIYNAPRMAGVELRLEF